MLWVLNSIARVSFMFEYLYTRLVLFIFWYFPFSRSLSMYSESQDVSILISSTRIIICIVNNCVVFSDKVTFLSFSI